MGRGRGNSYDPRNVLLGSNGYRPLEPEALSFRKTRKIADALIDKGYKVCPSCSSLASDCRLIRDHKRIHKTVHSIHPYVFKRAYGVKGLWKRESPSKQIIVPKGIEIVDNKNARGLEPSSVLTKRDTEIKFYTFAPTAIDLLGFQIADDDMETKLIWKSGGYTKSVRITKELWEAFNVLETLSKYFEDSKNLERTKEEFISSAA